MRKKYELDSINNSHIISVGETTDGNRITFAIYSGQQDPVEFDLDAAGFNELCDLRYKLSCSPPKVDKPLLSKVA